MEILKNNKLVFINGAGNKKKPNAGGYSYMIKFNNKEEIMERPARVKTTIYHMNLLSLIEVFKTIDNTDAPLLIFTTNIYIYNNIINKTLPIDYTEEWHQVNELMEAFKRNGGHFEIYLTKKGLRPTIKNAKKALHHFYKDNQQEGGKYLKNCSQLPLKKVFKEILRCFEITRLRAASGKKRCKV